MMTGKTTLSTLAAPPAKDWETRRRRAHELELPKAIESDSLSVGEAVIRRMPTKIRAVEGNWPSASARQPLSGMVDW
jgi:hypothetical protein